MYKCAIDVLVFHRTSLENIILHGPNHGFTPEKIKKRMVEKAIINDAINILIRESE